MNIYGHSKQKIHFFLYVSLELNVLKTDSETKSLTKTIICIKHNRVCYVVLGNRIRRWQTRDEDEKTDT